MKMIFLVFSVPPWLCAFVFQKLKYEDMKAQRQRGGKILINNARDVKLVFTNAFPDFDVRKQQGVLNDN